MSRITSRAMLTLAGLIGAYDDNSTSRNQGRQQRDGAEGMRPPALFRHLRPEAGQGEFSAQPGGATCHFATAANRDTFKASSFMCCADIENGYVSLFPCES